MLVTISATVDPATDLGFLLHKQPDKVHSFPVTAGRAHVFYPEATARRCTAAPDYTDPANLDRLQDRSLGAKRSLAAREYALGLEALDRLVEREPLWRVHECIFAVLALESEPVDPRL